MPQGSRSVFPLHSFIQVGPPPIPAPAAPAPSAIAPTFSSGPMSKSAPPIIKSTRPPPVLIINQQVILNFPIFQHQ